MLEKHLNVSVCILLVLGYQPELLLLFSRLVISDSFVTPWTVTRQAPLSMEFSRQEYRSGLPCPLPGDLPDKGVERASSVHLLHCRQILDC